MALRASAAKLLHAIADGEPIGADAGEELARAWLAAACGGGAALALLEGGDEQHRVARLVELCGAILAAVPAAGAEFAGQGES